MAYDGTLRYDTSIDTKGFQDDANKLDSIVKGLGLFKLIEAGFTLVAQSVERAVSRYDTLNRFPKILENMGYSASDAGDATQRLSDGVQGLPTALDDVVNTAQRLTVLTGNLDESVSATLALNNGFLASGASSADASRGLNQYVQMLSSGKVDMMSWRTLQETMGYALQQTAIAFGFAGESAQNDLYAALRDGDITFSEFNSKIIELNEGVGGFAEVAKTSTGGINTAFVNMNTRIAAGVTGVIAAIDSGFSHTRFKNIETLINNAGNTIRSVLNGVAGVFGFVAKNSETLIYLLGSIAAAMLAYKTYTFVVNFYQGLALAKAGYIALLELEEVKTAGTTAALWAYNLAQNAKMIALLPLNAAIIVWNALTGASIPILGGATAAQWGLNAAMLANPIGALIAAAVLLVAALVGLIALLSRGSAEYRKQKEEVKALAKEQEELKSSMDDNEKAFADSSNSIEANAAVTEKLIQNLRIASSSIDTTGAKQHNMVSTVKQLNAAVEGLNIAYDEETEVIMDLNTGQRMTLNQLEALVAAKVELSKANAWAERANELVAEQIKLLEEQEIIERKIKEIGENTALSDKEKKKLIEDLGETYDAYGAMVEDVQMRIDLANEKVAASDTAMAQTVIDDRKKMENVFAATNGALDKEGKNIQQLAKQYGISTSQILLEMLRRGSTLEEWSANNARYYTKEGQSLRGVATQWGLTADEVRSYIDGWGITLDDFVAEMEAAHTKEGLSLDELALKWGTTAAIIRTEMDNTGVSMQEWADKQQAAWDEYEATVKDRTAGVINSFKEIPGEYEKTGKELLKILIKNKERYAEWEATMEEITRQLGPTAAEEFAKLGPEATSAMQEILDSAELLDDYREVFGLKLDAVTGQVIEDWEDPAFIGAPSRAIDEAAALINENTSIDLSLTGVLKNAHNAASEIDYTDIGTGINASVANGLNSSMATAVDSAVGVVNGIGDGMMGAMTIVGKKLYAKASDIANSIAAAMASALDVHSPSRVMLALFVNVMLGIYQGMAGMAGTLYSQATDIAKGIADRLAISPTVVGNIVSRLRLITELDPLSPLSRAPQAAYAGTGTGSHPATVNLVQNISSPKPLSPSEMTREGQNLLRRSQWQLP